MAGYYQRELPQAPSGRPIDLGADHMAKTGALLQEALGSVRKRELEEARAAEEQKRYETELGFKQRQEQRAVDELNREQATREAIQAQLNPNQYRNNRLAEVDRAIEYGLSNLTPAERVEAEKEIAANYDRKATGKYVLDSARSNTSVDPIAILNAEAHPVIQGQRLASILNVGNTKQQTVNNQNAIDEAINKNRALAYAQEEYAKEFDRVVKDNPIKKGESLEAWGERLDSITKKNRGISPGVGILDYGLVDVPEYKETTREVALTPKERSNAIYERLRKSSVTPSTISEVSSIINNEMDTYSNLIAADNEAKINSAILEDYKRILASSGVNPDSITTIDGGKAALSALNKNKSSTGTVGFGPKSQEAVYATGLVDSIGINYADSLAKEIQSGNYNISDADLASLINTANSGIGPVRSKTQYNRILDMLKPYKKTQNN